MFSALSLIDQVAVSVVFWNVAGFLMWCIFITGHDCGHGTFSDYEWLNDVVGHITHGSILVPFYPWQLSHRRHHMYHNHIDKDYSHPWYTADKLQRPDEGLARIMDNYPMVRFFFPFFGWIIYLYGMPDGSHFVPFPSQRLWKDSPTSEYFKCIISSVVVLGYLAAAYFIYGQNIEAVAYFYLAPWVIMGWWLVTVTYLQHHEEDTLVYDDHDWKFVSAAFETVDRTYGFGIDTLHHHITDGHVVHHLFFTKIPHYNLPKATHALKKYLKSINLLHLYKSDVTYDFAYRCHKHFIDFGFRSTRASEIEDKKK
jgi:omega-3 fatty acid desaturase (delta-15 desaturase)